MSGPSVLFRFVPPHGPVPPLNVVIICVPLIPAIALAAVHAARPQAIRELTLADIDLPSRRITLAGHRQLLGDLTRNALLAWLGYRRATWPDTASRHVLLSRISALGTRPVPLTTWTSTSRDSQPG